MATKKPQPEYLSSPSPDLNWAGLDAYLNQPAATPPSAPGYAADIGKSIAAEVGRVGNMAGDIGRSLEGGFVDLGNKAGLVSNAAKDSIDEANVDAIGRNNAEDEASYRAKTLPGEVAQSLTHMAPAVVAGMVNPVLGVAAFGGLGAADAGMGAINAGDSLRNAQLKAVGQGALNTVLGGVVGGAGNQIFARLPWVGQAFAPTAADTAAGIGARMAQGAGSMAAFKPAGTAIDQLSDLATGETAGKKYDYLPGTTDLLTGALLPLPHAAMEYAGTRQRAAADLRAQKVPEDGPLSRAANAGIEQKALMLENNPEPLVSFPDGTVGRQSDVENYINSLPEEQRIAARAGLMGLGAQDVEAPAAATPEPASMLALPAPTDAVPNGRMLVDSTGSAAPETYDGARIAAENAARRQDLGIPVPRGAEPVMNPAGEPFKTEFAAKRAMKLQELADTHVVQPVDGGFVLQPTQEGVNAELSPGDVVPTSAQAAAQEQSHDETGRQANQEPDVPNGRQPDSGKPDAGSGIDSAAAVQSADAKPALTFKTEKGSIYSVNTDGTTIRNKAARPEHPGEEGLQPASKRTVYVSAEDAQKLGEIQAKGGSRRSLAFDDAQSKVAVRYIDGKDAGKIERRTVVPFKTMPEVGLTPVEYWGDDKTVHFGNKITEIDNPIKSHTFGPEVERYSGQYGKGMTGFNARIEAKKRNRERSDLIWAPVDAEAKFGPDRFDVVGYAKPTEARAALAPEAAKAETPAAEAPGTPALADRRQDSARRKAVAEMSVDEMKKALLTDEKTGLGNERAYNEVEKKAFQASIDVDSLGWINDHFGHEAGDAMLSAVGRALREETGDAFHLHGDEFAAHFDQGEEGNAVLDRVRKRLEGAELRYDAPDGSVTIKKGIGFSYGIGKDFREADASLYHDKRQREATGQRAAKGAEPAGVVRQAAAGRETDGHAAAEEITPTTTKDEHAAEKIPEQASAAAEHPNGNQGREAAEAGSGDRLQRAASSSQASKEAGQVKRSSGAQVARENLRRDNPFLAFLAEHGVSPADRADVGIEKGAAGVRMVPGFGPVFKKAGLRLDELALQAKDAGFLTQADIDSAEDTGGTRKLADMIRRAVADKEVIRNEAPAGTDADAQLMDEAQRLGIDTAGKSADDIYDAVVSAHADHLAAEVSDDELQKLVDAAWDASASSKILSDEGIDEIFGQSSQGTESRAADHAPRGSDEGGKTARDFALQGETAEEGRQRVAAEAQRQQEDVAARDAAARKESADAQVGDFSLTGSDRAADANPNQGNLLEQKRDEYTKDLFGEALPETAGKPASATRQPTAKRSGDMASADAVPKGSRFASRTHIVAEANRTIGAKVVNTAAEAAQAMSYLGRGAVERMDALVTDRDGNPLAIVGSFKGALTQASVYPATIAGEAFRIKNAANIWFAHNHPSGNAELSSADHALYRALENVFRGSHIEPRGLLAIAGKVGDERSWSLTDGQKGETAKPVATVDVPSIERQYSEDGKMAAAISNPTAAKTIAKEIAHGQAGIVLLDAQNRPVGFIPVENGKPLRGNGRMDALYRALSIANPARSMIVDNGKLGPDDIRNLAGFLNSIDANVLDVFDTSKAETTSWAMEGKNFDSRMFANVGKMDDREVTGSLIDHINQVADKDGMMRADQLRAWIDPRNEKTADGEHESLTALSTWLDAMGDGQVSRASVMRFLHVNDLPLFNEVSGPQTTSLDQSLYDDIGAGKTAKDVLGRIAKESADTNNRELAQALIDAGVTPDISQGDAAGKTFTTNAAEGHEYTAAFDPKENHVYLFRPADAERNVLHESVHAGTFAALRRGGLIATQMKALFQHVKQSGQADEHYGMQNVDEFTAEALSNPDFQKALRGITAMPEGSKFANAWQRFVDVVRRAIGLPVKVATALDQALRYGRGLIREGQAASEPGAMLPNVGAAAEQPRLHVPQWAKDLPEHVQAALRKSGAIYEDKTLKQKLTELKTGALKKMQYGILDQFAPIKDQVGKIPYILARMAKNADGTLEAAMLYGRPQLDAEGGMHVDTSKKGFVDVMQGLNGEHDRFFSWMAGKRAAQLKAEGRENLFTNDDISALSSLNEGEMHDGASRAEAYAKAQKDVAGLNKSVLDIAEKSGLIDPESRKVWESDFYVPFYRVMEEGVTGPSIKSGLVNQKSIKQLKGGTANLGDLTQNMLMNWSTLLTASAKNRAARATLDGAAELGAAIEADETTIRQMGKAINTKAVSYMDNGANRWFVVEDPHLLAAVSALDFNGYNNNAMKVMSTFKNYLTRAVTVTPLFKARNLIRDSVTTVAVSDADFNPLANVKKGFSLLRDEDFKAQMVAGGGVFRFGTLLEGNRGEHVKNLIDAGVKDETILDTKEKMQGFLQKIWDTYQEYGDLSENVNRAALYDKLRQEGKSHLEASFEARDLMDFGLSGAWAGVRALNQVLPFFNARLQGLYKLGRGYQDDPKRMGYVVGAVALASVALMLANKDDDDWKKRTDADRNNYWWFKVGSTAFRIPKPFEVGAMGSAIEHFSELFLDSENTNGKRFANQLGDIVNGQLAMNPIPQLFRPLIDVYANKDGFTGKPIETMGMQNLRPEDRYTANTSELARMLSKSGLAIDPISFVAGTGAKQLSPVQIDSMIKGYFSGLGVLATASVDGLLHHTVIDRGPALPMTLKDFAGSFAETLPSNTSYYVDAMYQAAQNIEQSYNSYKNAVKSGDTEKAQSILESEGPEIARYHLVERLKKDEGKITQQIQQIRNSKTLTGQEKADRIQALRQVQDRTARAFH